MTKMLAEVVEDRGLLGINGRRMYRIRPETRYGEDSAFELPEDELEKADAPPFSNPLLMATLELAAGRKRFQRIKLGKDRRSERRVTFDFTDGDSVDRYSFADHETLMGWIKETSTFFQSQADAFARPEVRLPGTDKNL